MKKENDIKPSIRHRSILAYLDLVILQMLTRRPMTGYEINSVIMKKFGVLVGPSTVYSKLSNMERKGWIRTLRENPGRVYGLTSQGQHKADRIKGISKEIQSFVRILLPS